MTDINKEPDPHAETFELDGAGIIYAVNNKKTWNRVIRFAAIMKENIQPEILARAISDVQKRFPTFFLQLDQDLFNYSLRTVTDTDILNKENEYPCGHIEAGSGNRPMFRVKYFKNRLSLETFHILSDGGGTMVFFRTLIARYLELQGFEVEKTDGVMDLNTTPTDAETEDSYKKVTCEETKKISRSEPFAYQYRQPKKENYFMLTHGFFRVDDIKQITKAKGVTVTEYLAALYTWALYENMLPANNKKPIKLSVPVDLRNIFGSTSLRSFSLYVNTCTYPKENLSLDEMLTEITAQLREGLKKEKLAVRVVGNTTVQNTRAFRSIPLFFKKAILKLGYKLFGEKTMTSAFTNLGIVKIPPSMADHVDHFDCVAAGTLNIYINCAIATCNGVIDTIFSSRSESKDVQRTFFTFLAKQGVRVQVQSNVKQKAVDSTAMLRCDSCNIEFTDNHLCCPLCGGKVFSPGAESLCVTAPYPELY
ncbi:MAG: hypothetical protein GXZ02_11570 [Clostridiales bacterium]|nr:hypothetical protein [Clostridiales bacterium]